MIQRVDILYPAVALALMTMALIGVLGLRRFIAVQKRAVDHRFYDTFDTAEGEPSSLRRHTRNVQNLFEAPPLFYVALLMIYVAGSVDVVILAAAWIYVALRVVHSLIHLSYNRVTHRFPVFAASMGVLVFIWIKLLLSLGS